MDRLNGSCTSWKGRRVGRSFGFQHSLKCCLTGAQPLRAAIIGWYCLVAAHLTLTSTASAQNPDTIGQFSPVMSWPWIAVHAHLLPTGKVLYWPQFNLGDNPTLWDPSTNTNTAGTHAGANIFCSSHAFLPNGQLLVAGGHIANNVGLVNAYTYNPLNNSWTRLPDMNNARWYPTNTTLPNGDVGYQCRASGMAECDGILALSDCSGPGAAFLSIHVCGT